MNNNIPSNRQIIRNGIILGLTIIVFIVGGIIGDNVLNRVAKSTKLETLYLSNLNVKLDSKKNKQTIKVRNDINKVDIQAGAENNDALITVTGNDNLVVGKNEVLVTVTPEKGEIKTYTIDVVRKGENDPKSSNNNLTNITIDNVKLQPSFSSATTNYNAPVENNISQITINITKQDNNQLIDGIGTKALVVGVNKFNIKVTAEDGSTKVYTINVTRKEATASVIAKQSNNNNLKSLSVGSVVLSPSFDHNILTYSGEIDKIATQINILGETEDSKAFVEGLGIKPIVIGLNTFNIKVTAENGETKTYTLYITRKVPIPVKQDLSSNCNLASLSIPGVTLNESFNKDTTNYTGVVSKDINDITITANKEDSKASISGAGTKSLVVGINKFSILVIAETGNTKTYNITITKQIEPSKILLIFMNGQYDSINMDENNWKTLAVSNATDFVLIPNNANTTFSETVKSKLEGGISPNVDEYFAGYRDLLAPRIINSINKLTAYNPNAKIWIGTPADSDYNIITAFSKSSLNPFTSYFEYIKEQIGETKWNNNVRGIYMSQEEVMTPIDDYTNLMANAEIKLMNDLSYRIHTRYNKQFLWIPYYGIGNQDDKINKYIAYIADAKSIFDIVIIQPHYYFDFKSDLRYDRYVDPTLLDRLKSNVDAIYYSILKQDVTDKDGNPYVPQNLRVSTRTVIGAEMESDWVITGGIDNYNYYISKHPGLAQMRKRYDYYFGKYKGLVGIYPIALYWDGAFIQSLANDIINPLF